jgi:hypothetical protein
MRGELLGPWIRVEVGVTPERPVGGWGVGQREVRSGYGAGPRTRAHKGLLARLRRLPPCSSVLAQQIRVPAGERRQARPTAWALDTSPHSSFPPPQLEGAWPLDLPQEGQGRKEEGLEVAGNPDLFLRASLLAPLACWEWGPGGQPRLGPPSHAHLGGLYLFCSLTQPLLERAGHWTCIE